MRVELLTNRDGAADRRRILAELAAGTVDMLIGTHALIQEGVEFRSLGVVVIDEQHRFGVEQRAALRGKAGDDPVPDVLVMTATPIPRTAAMTVYGDLDVTVLTSCRGGPPRRSRRRGPHARRTRPACGNAVRAEVDAGRQAYVVCPLIEESEKLEVALGRGDYERLQAEELTGCGSACCTGGSMPAEKEAAMDRSARASSTCWWRPP